MSVMLLSEVASAQAEKAQKHIARTIELTISLTMLLGIFCFGLFFVLGKEMGLVLFHNLAAGTYIRIMAWLCPFLYLSATLGSILHGLGKTFRYFLMNISCITIRILSIVFLVPKFGLKGYLWGMLMSQLLFTALILISLKRYIPFRFQCSKWIASPVCSLFCSAGITLLADLFINQIDLVPVVRLIFNCAAYCLPFAVVTLVTNESLKRKVLLSRDN